MVYTIPFPRNELNACYRCGSLSLATREDLGAGAGEVS